MILLSLLFLTQVLYAMGQSCMDCEAILMTSSGGVSNSWPILLNEWTLEQEFDANPQYKCDACFGTRKKFIWLEDRWSVVDCTPENPEACHGVTEFLMSPSVARGTCPWEIQGGWRYCSGSAASGTCDGWSTDDTFKITCV